MFIYIMNADLQTHWKLCWALIFDVYIWLQDNSNDESIKIKNKRRWNRKKEKLKFICNFG